MAEDFVESYYTRVRTDPEYRARLIENPTDTLCELHGVERSSLGDTRFEIVEQDPNTVTILVPAAPDGYSPGDRAMVREIAHRTVDLMYSQGIPGFLIPTEELRWTLLEMRASWLAKEGVSA